MSYQDVKDRLYHGHKKIANNTYLTLHETDTPEEYIFMMLHGNVVARFNPDGIELFSAGWHTSTTKNRLNLALELAKLPTCHYKRVYQLNYQWFYGHTSPQFDTKFYDGIKIDYTGNIIR